MLWSLACGDVFVTWTWWWECWYVCPSAEMGSTWTGLLGLGGRREPESSEQQEPPAETRSRESRPTARRTILLSPSYPVTADLVVTTFVTRFLRFVTGFQGFVTQIQPSQFLQIWWCILPSPLCDRTQFVTRFICFVTIIKSLSLIFMQMKKDFYLFCEFVHKQFKLKCNKF